MLFYTSVSLPYLPGQPPTFKLKPKDSFWEALQTVLSLMCFWVRMHVSHSTAIISASVLLSLFGPFAAPRRPSFADHGNLIKSQLLELRTESLEPLSPTHFESPLHMLSQTDPDLLGLASRFHFYSL